jgi:hypothetical protein
MFEAKERAEAVVLAIEPSGGGIVGDMHGTRWVHRKYILEVRPAGQRPFRVEAEARVGLSVFPGTGDSVTVTFDPKNHKTEIHIEGDPRWDPRLVREARREREAARNRALLNGGTYETADLAMTHEIADRALSHNAEQLAELRRARAHPHAAQPEPQWTVPELCPECGARVDQFTGSKAEDPRCEYCHSPLPRIRVR